MLAASADPKAARRYRAAGFTLHPAMLMTGRVPRDVLPVVERVREGSVADIDLMNSVDRQVRDAAHGPTTRCSPRSSGSSWWTGPPALATRTCRPGAGPTCSPPPTGVRRPTCSGRRWRPLPDSPCSIGHISAENEWAVDVGMAARLDLYNTGYLAFRGMRPPMPYLPSGHFL